MANEPIKNDLSNGTMRLDRWLWCARFFKSRQLATSAVKANQIKVNGSQAKPSRSIKIGDCLTIQKSGYTYEVTIMGLAAARLPAKRMSELYLESQESELNRQRAQQENRLMRLSGVHLPKQKPDKKQRRLRMDLKREQK